RPEKRMPVLLRLKPTLLLFRAPSLEWRETHLQVLSQVVTEAEAQFRTLLPQALILSAKPFQLLLLFGYLGAQAYAFVWGYRFELSCPGLLLQEHEIFSHEHHRTAALVAVLDHARDQLIVLDVLVQRVGGIVDQRLPVQQDKVDARAHVPFFLHQG